jgi:hypothetical protein
MGCGRKPKRRIYGREERDGTREGRRDELVANDSFEQPLLLGVKFDGVGEGDGEISDACVSRARFFLETA